MEDAYSVDFYEPPERIVALNLRVDERTKRGLEALVSLWRAFAIARGENPKAWSLNAVAERLLQVGQAGALTEVLQSIGLKKMPADASEWQQFEAALAKIVEQRLASAEKPSKTAKSRR
jgi:hypothetical protein